MLSVNKIYILNKFEDLRLKYNVRLKGLTLGNSYKRRTGQSSASGSLLFRVGRIRNGFITPFVSLS